MKLSLVLPSLFPNALHRTIGNLRATTRGVDYEILAVTPFEVAEVGGVRWIREDESRGGVAAHTLAYSQMTGDILVALADDVLLVDNWAELCLKRFLAREAGRDHFCIGLHQTNFVVGAVCGIYFPFFAVVRASTLRVIGGHYDPAYVAHYADPDLALRIWKAGGRCERTDIPLISRVEREGEESIDSPAKTGRSEKRDIATFAERWRSTYGSGWRFESMEDFNLDVDAVFELVVGDECSIFVNDPIFKRLHENYLRNAALWKIAGPGILPPRPRG